MNQFIKRIFTLFKINITFLLLLSFSILKEEAYASRMHLRMANGQFAQETGQSYTSTLAPELSISTDIFENWDLGIGGDFFYNNSTANVDFWGIKVFSRYYFKGHYKKQELASATSIISFFDSWVFYLGPEIKRYKYSLGENPEVVANFENYGEFFNINFLIGGNYRLSKKTSLDFEINRSIMQFSMTDNRVKAAVTQFLIGVAFDW